MIPDDWESNTPIERRRAVRRRAPWEFDQDSAFKALTQQFGTKDLVGFDCQDLTLGLGAAGALLSYALSMGLVCARSLHGARTHQSEVFNRRI